MKSKHLTTKEIKHFTSKQILDAYDYFSNGQGFTPISFVNSGRHFSSITITYEALQRRLDYYVATYGDDFTDVKIDDCDI